MSNNTLPEDSDARKDIPICTGVVDYFPAALAEVAKISKLGNDKHNPGQPLNWSRNKSLDHADCIMRHLVDRGGFAEDGTRHSAALAWRALALLQDEMEREGAPVPKTPRLDGRGPAADAADEREKLAAKYEEMNKLRNSIIESILADMQRRPRYIFETNPGPNGSWVKDVMDAAEKDVRVVTGIDKASPGGDHTAYVTARVRKDGILEVVSMKSVPPFSAVELAGDRIDWKEGESWRIVNGVKVYRDYGSYVDD